MAPLLTPAGWVTALLFTAAYGLVVSAWYGANYSRFTAFVVEEDAVASIEQHAAAASHNTTSDGAPDRVDAAPVPSFGSGLPPLDWFAETVRANRDTWLSCGPYPLRWSIQAITFPLLAYWTAAYLVMLADVWFEATGKLARFKNAHKGFTPKLDHRLYRKAIGYMLGLHVFTLAAHCTLYHPLASRWVHGGWLCDARAPWLPSDAVGWGLLLAKLLGMYLLTDVIFYCMHRLCHEVPFLYKHVHKYHHQWVVTYGIDAAAAHPFEQVFVNMNTVELPGLLLAVPYPVLVLWHVVGNVNTVLNHSGYNLMGTVAHDRHHHFNNCEYGTDTFCDRLFATTYAARNLQREDKKKYK